MAYNMDTVLYRARQLMMMTSKGNKGKEKEREGRRLRGKGEETRLPS